MGVADLGRQSGGRRAALLIGEDETAGLRLAPLGGRRHDPHRGVEALAAQDAQADAEEERRLFYVAMTRARELLILSGGTDTTKWPAPRNGGPPIDWIVRALTPSLQLPELLERTWDGRIARLRIRVNNNRDAARRGAREPPADPAPGADRAPGRSRQGHRRSSSAAAPRRSGCPTASCPTTRSAATASTSSASSTCSTSSRRRPWRASRRPSAASTRCCAARSSTRALEELDFDAPRAPDDDAVRALTRRRAHGRGGRRDPGVRRGVRALTALPPAHAGHA